MWLGTADGLNRYDGYQFVQYKFDPSRSDSLSANSVNTLLLTKKNDLWVGTYGGLNRYDDAADAFQRFPANEEREDRLISDRITALAEHVDGRIWVGTAKGLNLLDPETGKVTRWAIGDGPGQLPTDHVTALAVDQRSRLWVGTLSNLYIYDPATNVFSKGMLGDDYVAVYSLLASDQAIWVGSMNNLLRWDAQSDALKPVTLSSGEELSDINDLFEDSRGDLWIATRGSGLLCRDKEDGSISFFKHDARDDNTISSDDVLSIYEDRSGVLWAGLDVRGLSLLDPYAAKFAYQIPSGHSARRPSSTNISSILVDSRGGIWMGTWFHGLNLLDRGTGTYKHFREGTGDQFISNDRVTALYEDHEGFLWIGGGNGLSKYDHENGRFTHYMPDPQEPRAISDGAVTWIMEDSQDRFWVGVMGSGIHQFDRESGTFQVFPNRPDSFNQVSHNAVRMIYEDKNGVLWMGTMGGGLARFDGKGGFESFLYDPKDPFSISHNMVLSISESNGFLWVGTWGGGFNKFDVSNRRFVRYTEQNSDLPSNVVYGMLNDENGNLWLSTNRGLSRFHVETGQFTNYDVDDGLQSKEFNQGAFFKAPDGEMLFGGINGFNTFYPNRIQDNPFAPEVALTDVRIMGDSVYRGRGRESVNLSGTTLKLSHWQNDLSFEFVGLHFSRPQENLYRHILENYDRTWTLPGPTRSATYTNLDPGTYFFRVKTANNDGVWNNRGLSLKVVISPPWWRTYPAYGLYTILLIGLLVSINRWQQSYLIRRERQRSQIKETRLRAEAAEMKTAMVEAQSKALRIERAALEAENNRKNAELANARDLQLSMLPKQVPHHPGLEIGTYMETATEVGGDYYDFKTDDEGTLTAVIGDATGHGLQAGTVVTATKSLFISLSREMEPVPLLRKMSQVLKEMGFQSMFMGLSIARFRKNSLHIASAGMPYPLLYRHKSGQLEEIEAKGMPLGTMPDFPYRTIELHLEAGDTLILMSDGLQESFNDKNQMLGVTRTQELFAEVASQGAREIIQHLVDAGKKWRNYQAADDDITFVVFKYRP